MKIAVLTFHRAYNCGALLQAWALRKVLERMGHVVEFPLCNHVGETERFCFLEWRNRDKSGVQWLRSVVGRAYLNLRRLPENLFSIPSEDILRYRYHAFQKRFLKERDCGPEMFKKYYDTVVIGSDQVWNPIITGADAALFLNERGAGLKTIAYAASYGDVPLEGKELDRVRNALRNFSAISVRERVARMQLSSLTDQLITEVLDPTLLLCATDYDEIGRDPIERDPYLFVYALKIDKFLVDAAKSLAGRLGVKCIIAPCYQFSRLGAMRGLTYSVSPDRLVRYVRHAKYVIAGSFHGTAMAVIFNKPVLSYRAKEDAYESRPAALLRKIGLSNHLVTPKTTIDEMEHMLRESPVNYGKLLEGDRNMSLQWLRENVG